MTDSVSISLTKGKAALIDREDEEITRRYSWHITSDHGGRPGYAATVINRRKVGMARLIMGAVGDSVVDHINGNTLDNRKINLRICSQKENSRNKRASISNSSGYKGVSFDSRDKSYRAYVSVDGRSRRLGGYDTALHAAVAYDEAAKEQYGEFASLNFSPSRDWILPTPLPLRGPNTGRQKSARKNLLSA